MKTNIPAIRNDINTFLNATKHDPVWKKFSWEGVSIHNIYVLNLTEEKVLQFEYFLKMLILSENRDLSEDHIFIMSISGRNDIVNISIPKDGALGLVITLTKLVELIGIHEFYSKAQIQLRNDRDAVIENKVLRAYAEDLMMKRIIFIMGAGKRKSVYKAALDRIIGGV
jgi:hypothetical protein